MHEVKIYSKEKQDGIDGLVKSSASVAYATQLKLSDSNSEVSRAMAQKLEKATSWHPRVSKPATNALTKSTPPGLRGVCVALTRALGDVCRGRRPRPRGLRPPRSAVGCAWRPIRT